MIAELATWACWVGVRVLIYGADLAAYLYDMGRDFAADIAPWESGRERRGE